MIRHRALAAICLAALVCVVAGCSTPPDVAGDTAPRAVGPIAIPNARVPLDGVLSGGQPTAEQIAAAGRSGFRTVINLRTDAEDGFAWEGPAVESAGMRYVRVPVDGAEGLTRETVQRVDAALGEALAAGPVLLHCGSGNRIGAVLALRAAWIEGVAPADALHVGLASGLTRLEGATRERLGLPPPEPATAPR